MQSDLFSGEYLRDIGIERSVNKANKDHDKWSDIAYSFLLHYIKSNPEFMAENVRNESLVLGLVPEPTNKRAWGAIFVKAARLGLIKRIGFKNVTNSKAHCTPATVWGRC